MRNSYYITKHIEQEKKKIIFAQFNFNEKFLLHYPEEHRLKRKKKTFAVIYENQLLK